MSVVTDPTTGLRDTALESRIRSVPDPEIPVITLDDLGVIRAIEEDGDVVRVTMTPTYSGCPAMEAMEQAVAHAIREAGRRAEIVIQLDPPWTTDWMSDAGRERLARFGIAPPRPAAQRRGGPVSVSIGRREIACPLCGSQQTEVVSAFGATACKALRRCLSCREPFEEFKPL